MSLPKHLPTSVNLAAYLEPDQPDFVAHFITKTLDPAIKQGPAAVAACTPEMIQYFREQASHHHQTFVYTPLVLVRFDSRRALHWVHLTCTKTLNLLGTHGQIIDDKRISWRDDVNRVLISNKDEQFSPSTSISLLTIDADNIDCGSKAELASNLISISRQIFFWWFNNICGVTYVIAKSDRHVHQAQGLAEGMNEMTPVETNVALDTIGPGLKIRTGSPEKLSQQLTFWLQ
jgi:hypothetical protein